MGYSLAQIAEMVDGQLVGDGRISIDGAAVLADAKPGDITLVDTAEKAARLGPVEAAAAIVPRGVTCERLPTIEVDDIHATFSRLITLFRPPRVARRIGISSKATVSQSARLGADVDVHPGVTIADDVEIGPGSTVHAGVHVMAGCKIGQGVTIYPNAVLYEDTVVGPRSVVHAGAVLGAHGFGYKFIDGRHQLSSQFGWVEIGPDVEVGAGSTIDRGTYGPTVIGEGTKIDNLVMVAHNCRIGRHNMLCSQVGIAGSTTTGDYVVMAGQVGVRDHVHIGRGAVLGAKAGVSNDVPEGTRVIGIPATEEREQKVKQAAIAKLPELRRQIKALQAAVDALQRAAGQGESKAA
ncbi:MAG: UDP-3-O-(3-hydroxymyristoyl)glucosamine N-acyltransferase [Planctomycetia bacterium]|nr:UDP-3-O-(3-hydroxymyristoyl)glucosamine N-acyltransferase [Planctomycetia bacterium]